MFVNLELTWPGYMNVRRGLLHMIFAFHISRNVLEVYSIVKAHLDLPLVELLSCQRYNSLLHSVISHQGKFYSTDITVVFLADSRQSMEGQGVVNSLLLDLERSTCFRAVS